jgi:hypothetical protein
MIHTTGHLGKTISDSVHHSVHNLCNVQPFTHTRARAHQCITRQICERCRRRDVVLITHHAAHECALYQHTYRACVKQITYLQCARQLNVSSTLTHKRHLQIGHQHRHSARGALTSTGDRSTHDVHMHAPLSRRRLLLPPSSPTVLASPTQPAGHRPRRPPRTRSTSRSHCARTRPESQTATRTSVRVRSTDRATARAPATAETDSHRFWWRQLSRGINRSTTTHQCAHSPRYRVLAGRHARCRPPC